MPKEARYKTARYKVGDKLFGKRLKKGTIYIYGLFDPTNDEVRYVGRTSNPPIRLAGHLNIRNGIKSKKDEWIRDMKSRGIMPYMLILEVTSSAGQRTAERRWLQKFPNLLNRPHDNSEN